MKVLGFNINIENLSKKRPAEVKKLDDQITRTSNPHIYVDRIEMYDRNIRGPIDIRKWRDALITAEGFTRNRRYLYKEIYPEIILDAHLTGVMNARKNKVLGNPFKIVDDSGEEITEATRLFQTQWFYDFQSIALDKIFWGYSLIELNDVIEDKFSCVELYPRIFVKPEFGIVVDDPSDLEGVFYEEEPYHNWYVGAGDKCDLGLLNKAAPYVILKRNGLGAYAEYIELFGIPMRVIKSNIKDKDTRASLENMAKNSGKAPWIVIDHETSVEFVAQAQSDGSVLFTSLADFCNKEISKLILGQTMTTEDGSSQSQATVHEGVANDVARADMRDMEFLVNDQLIPRMITLGFKLKGLHFKYDYSEKVSLTELATIATGFIGTGRYEVDEDWVLEKFGIPLEKVAQPRFPQFGNQIQNSNGDGGEKKSILNSASTMSKVRDLYKNGACKICGGQRKIVNQNDEEDFSLLSEEEVNDLVQKIYDGVVGIKNLPKNVYSKTADSLLKALYDGFGGNLKDFPLGTPDYKMLKALQENIYAFSGAKTFQQVKDIVSLLTDGDEIVPFNEFKKSATSVIGEYNDDYLQTEYNSAIAQSQAASQWLDIEEDKDVLPYLKYQTAGDSRVRPTHAELDNITRDVDDPFWDNYMPPNGWNCRCTAIQISDGTVTDLKGFSKPNDVPDVFMMNAGKDRLIFSKEHPYFQVEKKYKEYAKKNFDLEIPEE